MFDQHAFVILLWGILMSSLIDNENLHDDYNYSYLFIHSYVVFNTVIYVIYYTIDLSKIQ